MEAEKESSRCRHMLVDKCSAAAAAADDECGSPWPIEPSMAELMSCEIDQKLRETRHSWERHETGEKSGLLCYSCHSKRS